LMMISRPFEGLLFAAPLMLALAWHLLRKLAGRDLWPVVRAALPTVLLTGAGALLMLSYNASTTGDPLTDPYSLHRSTHAIAPPFLFQEKTTPTLSLPDNMRRWYEYEAQPHDRRHSMSGLLSKGVVTIRNVVQFYVGPLLVIPFILGLLHFVSRRNLVLLASAALLGLGVLVNTWDFSQYWSPGFGLFVLAIMLGFDRLRHLPSRWKASGLYLSRALPVGAAVLTAVPAVALYAGSSKPLPETFVRSCCIVHTQAPRQMVVQQLVDSPGRDLVIVRHRPDDPSSLTLVANEPDIDASEIVWAHDLGAANQRLFDRYPDRRVWRVNGTADTRATPYTPSPGEGR
jgi:hypothetical protein